MLIGGEWQHRHSVPRQRVVEPGGGLVQILNERDEIGVCATDLEAFDEPAWITSRNVVLVVQTRRLEQAAFDPDVDVAGSDNA